MAPEKVLKYVVVHELVHLKEKDHNNEFWSIIEKQLPNYEESKRWLEENSTKLVFSRENL